MAERHASWELGIPSILRAPKSDSMPTIIAVGGGKGGVGKSILSANLSSILAQAGLRILVVDLDLGCANLHTHFGVSMPGKTLADYLLRKTDSFRDIILPAPIQGVAFIAGGREEEWAEVFHGHKDGFSLLWREIFASRRELDVDLVVLDLGAGTHQHTMQFFSAAHLGIVTVLPEPTSIENAYVFLRMALWNLIEHLGERLKEVATANQVKAALAAGSIAGTGGGYVDILRGLRSDHPEFIRQLVHAIHGRYVGLVVNQTRDQADVDVGKSMEHIIARYFGLQTKFLGHLNYDESVWKSLKNRRLLVSDFPHSSITKNLSMTATLILKLLGINGGHTL